MSPLCLLTNTLPTDIAALSLHDALPICWCLTVASVKLTRSKYSPRLGNARARAVLRPRERSEEHTSELQSRENLVCRLLLEKKNWPDSQCRRDRQSLKINGGRYGLRRNK